MPVVVPLQLTPSQTFNIVLNGQSCTLNVYQKPNGLFMDVLVNNVAIITSVICENLNYIVRSVYLGFIGDFVFYDTQGLSDPVYTGLGPISSARYLLLYLFPGDLPPTYGDSGP